MAEINYLDMLDKELKNIVALVGEEARNRHCKAFLIGGIVRDLILRRKNCDLDIVVEGDALQLAQAVGKILKMDLKVHEAFQTGTLVAANNMRIDFATSRREMYPKPGALPVVETAHLDADIFRRDFTINALAISINPDTFGKLIDLYGGMADLQKGLIRIFHENSFVDDPTRVLRAVRFEQRFNFEIERATWQLFQESVRQKRYETVKAPRYFNEFKKILLEEDPIPALKRLKASGGLNFWSAPIKFNLKALTALRRKIVDSGRRNIMPEFSNNWLLYLMALMEDLDRKKFLDILNKIQMKRELADSVVSIKDRAKIFKALARQGLCDSEIFRILQPYTSETLLYFLFRSTNALIRKRIEHYFKKTRTIQLKIDGEDIKRLGVHEGKRVGIILNKVLNEKIDRSLRTKGQEIKVAKVLLGLT